MTHLRPLIRVNSPSSPPHTLPEGQGHCRADRFSLIRGVSGLVISGIFLISCALATPNQQDTLKESVLLFNEGVRWGRLQDVMPRVAPEHADNFVEMHKDFGKTIQISDYEIINTTANWKEKRAEVTVQITWYRNTEMELHTTVLSQQWEQVGVDWVMMAESYVSGKPLL